MIIKSTVREIRTSLARYLAIFAIVALGVGFFSGLKICKTCMVITADKYLSEHNMYDYMLMSSFGIDDESVRIAEAEEGVACAEGSVQIDVMAEIEHSSEEKDAEDAASAGTTSEAGAADTAADSDDAEASETAGTGESALRAISLPQNINTLELVSGRMPRSVDECVADDYSMGGDGFKVGDKIILTESNGKDKLSDFLRSEYTVVGTVNSPIYLDYQRGSTDIGNGSLSSFFYIDRSAFNVDYYTRLYLKLEGDELFFTDEKSDLIDAEEDHMKDLAERITEARRDTATEEARKRLSYAAGDLVTLLTAPAYEAERDHALKRLDEAEAKLDKKQEKLSQERSKAATDEDLSKIEKGQERIDRERAALNEEREKVIRESDEREKKIADAREILEIMKSDMDEMETGNSYAVSVYQDPGYSAFDSNSSIVSNIAKVFPVFFFLIAALVCMTTMTRMVEEQRTQIGVLKALGYSNESIVSKYMLYSGSASFAGAVTGFFIGCRVFPLVIWRAYGMMYGFIDDIAFVLDVKLGLIALACALICSMGATWVSISQDFKVSPSELIRPKTPPAGKRILLERIGPLWSRISFLYKVSFRNIFRDKKRFLMMVIGVSGCTALLVAGMGIGTSVADIADHQFNEISLYDFRAVFSKNMNKDRQQAFLQYMADEADVSADEIIFVHQAEVILMKDGREVDVTCTAADEEAFENFVDLHDGEEPVKFPGSGEAVIVRNISRQYGLDIGDRIRIRDGYREGELTVSGICDNYMYDTIYMSKETYEDAFGKKPEIKSAMVRLAAGSGEAVDADVHEAADTDAASETGGEQTGTNAAATPAFTVGAVSEDAIREAATIAANYENAAAVTVNLDMKDSISKMMQSLDLVTYVIIISAALLAFVVLYNLTNINITERIREIATIKVLGFNQLEVAQYVFRENIFMTAIAAIVGIPLGKWLLIFAFDNISVKMMYFEERLTFSDIAWAVVLTFVFSALVNLAMQRRLANVSMTESLKSIE